jgi:AsmA-like C-terminal region
MRRRKWLIMTAGALLGIAVVLFGVSVRLSPLAREWLVKALKEHYESDIGLDHFSVSLFPRVRAKGKGLVFRHKGRTDVPPLISIQQFSVDTGVLGLLSTPKRARNVRLEGLQIHVPPRGNKDSNDHNREKGEKRRIPPFVIEEIIADGTLLEILPKKAGKQPLTFEIYRLTLHSVGVDRPMSFRATLTNPKPPGRIQSTGEFGPWAGDEPGLTPVSGSYTFQDADLSVFRGIAGILSSDGRYQGVLERIEVKGNTDVPDFTVTSSGKPVHLKTEFSAVVDGTNGDTLLEPVDAQFLHSLILARGGVVGTPGVKGKTVSLDVSVAEARLEDLLRLAVKSDQPPMTGVVSFNTKFELPPGEQDIIDKLNLDGAFGIGAARFTSLNVQQKVEALSRRGKGETDDSNSESVVSDMQGRFVLKNGVMAFSNLSFRVPGASVRLNGTYGLRTEKLDFRGTLRLEAKLSETTTGVKSLLLRAVDPLFKKKGAGAVLPIKITGTRREPSFGLDIGRAAIPGR